MIVVETVEEAREKWDYRVAVIGQEMACWPMWARLEAAYRLVGGQAWSEVKAVVEEMIEGRKSHAL